MLRALLVFGVLAFSAQLAQASQAGQVIFVAGQASIAERAAVLNAPVDEGALLSTGADGYIYIKTIDNGLFILRPSSRARIASYHIDAANPANTRIKLELLSGVARSQSGEAVKLARQNFRFNTPVAAIGVRGTDFSVSTDQDVTRVTVLSGGITISGFAGACRPEGTGPCEGSASRELSATQKGQLLQIQRGQAAAQLLPVNTLAPDGASPPRPDEPAGKSAGVGSPAAGDTASAAVEAKKVAALPPLAVVDPQPPKVPPSEPSKLPEPSPPSTPLTPLTPVVPPTEPPKPAEKPPADVVPPVAEIDPPVETPKLPERTIVWGRFDAVAFAGQEKSTPDLIAKKGNFALFRTDGEKYVTPERGSVEFALEKSQAEITNSSGLLIPGTTTLQDGVLKFDFDKSTFKTSFNAVSLGESFSMQSEGKVQSDGTFSGSRPYYDNQNNMYVEGVLSSEKGGSAAYIFQGSVSGGRTIWGATYWGKK